MSLPGSPSGTSIHSSATGIVIGNNTFQTNVFSGNSRGNVVQGGNMYVSGGRMVVNGVDVTDVVNERSGPGGDPEPLSMVARIPPGSSVDVSLVASDVELDGTFDDVRISLQTGEVSVDGSFQTAHVTSVSGDIYLGDVPAGAHVTAESISGVVTARSVHGRGNLSSMSGGVAVDFADPEAPLALRSMSGDVRYGVGSFEALDHITASTTSGHVIQQRAEAPPRRATDMPGFGDPHGQSQPRTRRF